MIAITLQFLISIEERVKQILLVLRKDCRKLWREIALVCAITAAFIWLYPSEWRIDEPPFAQTGILHLDLHHLQLLATGVAILWPFSWLLLIARAVHDESLVGSRQFWVTRPFLWQNLLIEKLLFTLLFVGFPFIAAQAGLLVRAGFSPTHYIGAILLSLFMMWCALILPIFALSTITPSLIRIFIILFGTTGAIVAAAFFSSSTSYAPVMFLPHPLSDDHVVIPLSLAFGGGIVLAQYAIRNLWVSGYIFLAFVAAMLVVTLGPFDHSLFERTYPTLAPRETSPITVTVPPDSQAYQDKAHSDSKYVRLIIPIEISGIALGQEFSPDNVRMTVDSVDGSHWASEWTAVYDTWFMSDRADGSVGVVADKEFFRHANALGATLHLEIAFTQLEAESSRRAIFQPDQDLSIPSIGFCRNEVAGGFDTPNFSCLTAFRKPPLSHVTALMAQQPCAASDQLQPGSYLVDGWVGYGIEASQTDVDVNLAPISTLRMNLAPSELHNELNENGDTISYGLCPGSPIVVTPFRLVRRFQYRMELSHGSNQPPSHL